MNKKLLSLMAALMLVVGMMSGCSTTPATESAQGVASAGDYAVNGGLYMRFMLDAYNLAGTYNTESEDLLDITIEDKSATQWILDSTTLDVERYLGVMNKFDELGLEYTDIDQTEVDAYAAQMLTTYSTLFEPNGIGLQTLKDYYEYSTKSSDIFLHYYGEGGEMAVPTEEVDTYLRENYNLTQVMVFDKPMPTLDDEGNEVAPTQEDIDAAEASARSYYDRIVAGESFDDLYVEWEIGVYAGEENIPHTHDDPLVHNLYTQMADPNLPVAYTEVMDVAPLNEVQFIEDEYGYYVAIRLDVLADGSVQANYSTAALMELRSDEFREMAAAWGSELEIAYNSSELSSYTPEIMHENMSSLGGV